MWEFTIELMKKWEFKEWGDWWSGYYKGIWFDIAPKLGQILYSIGPRDGNIGIYGVKTISELDQLVKLISVSKVKL